MSEFDLKVKKGSAKVSEAKRKRGRETNRRGWAARDRRGRKLVVLAL